MKESAARTPFANLSRAVTGDVIKTDMSRSCTRILYLFDEYFCSPRAQLAYKLPVFGKKAFTELCVRSHNNTFPEECFTCEVYESPTFNVLRYGDLWHGIIEQPGVSDFRLQVGGQDWSIESKPVRVPLGVFEFDATQIPQARLLLLANRFARDSIFHKLPRDIAVLIARKVTRHELVLLYKPEVGTIPLLCLQFHDVRIRLCNATGEDIQPPNIRWLYTFLEPQERMWMIQQPHDYKGWRVVVGFGGLKNN